MRVALPPPAGDPPELHLGTTGPIAAAEILGSWAIHVDTSSLPPGRTPWEIWAGSALLASGHVHVRPSLRAGQDTRTHEEKVLAALKDALLRLAAEDEVSITIHGRSVTFKDPEKVQAMIGRYQVLVDAQQGRGPFKKIPVRLS